MKKKTEITHAENQFCIYQLGAEGGFISSLIVTIMRADDSNANKLAAGFSGLVTVVKRYQNESGYWEDLCSRWNTFHPTMPLD